MSVFLRREEGEIPFSGKINLNSCTSLLRPGKEEKERPGEILISSLKLSLRDPELGLSTGPEKARV